MLRHVVLAVLAVPAALPIGLVGGSAGAEAQAPPSPPSPEIEVSPVEGFAVGDTLTVTGTGFVRVPLGRPWVALCAAPPIPDGAALGSTDFAAIEAECAEASFADVAADGTFTLDLPVTTAAASMVWAGGPDLSDGSLRWSTATAPVSALPRGGREVRMAPSTSIAYAGQAPSVRAVLDHPPAAIRARSCSAAVLADPTSPELVESSCHDAGAVDVTADAVGEVVASPELVAGAGAVWIGGPTPEGFVGGAVELQVHDPAATVTPSAGLVDGQTVTITVDDLGPPGRGAWGAYQCDTRVLDAGAGIDPTLYCTAVPVQGAVDENGTLAIDLVVEREPTLGPTSPLPRVDCRAAAGTCAVVAYGYFDDGQPPAYYGVPVSFGDEDLPVVMPAADLVVEGDEGSVTGHVPVRLSAPAAEPVTVSYNTFDPWPSLSWAATSGEDFVPTSGTVTFQPGETEVSIPVEVVGDTVPEEAEMALLGLTDPDGAVVGGFAGIGGVGITDDD